jgi:hypothetical protein
MGMDRGIFYREQPNARVSEPEPERKRREAVFEIRNNQRVIVAAGDVGAPAGSIDLCSLNYPASDVENWGRGVRVQDVVATVDHTMMFIADLMSQVLRDERADGRKSSEAVNAKLAALAAENRELRGSVAEMRGELAAIVEIQIQSELARAPRGSGSAAPIVKPRIRPKRNQVAPVLAS